MWLQKNTEVIRNNTASVNLNVYSFWGITENIEIPDAKKKKKKKS